MNYLPQCSRKHLRVLKYLTNQIASFNRAWSSSGIYDEDFVRSALLDEHNKQELIRKLEKLGSWEKKTLKDIKQASVLIPLCFSDEKLSILYTRRSPQLKANGGQPSFPGGKIDDSDTTIADAALRECEEEIGIPSHDIDVWSTLGSVPDRNRRFIVHPVLGFIRNYNPSNLTVNKGEVQEVFTVPIAKLLDPNNHGYTFFRNGWRMPVYKASPVNVWGMTAILTDVFLANAFPEKYKLIVKAGKFKK